MNKTVSSCLNLSPARAIFANRTLNLRSIKAIGYDMDYTLIHYHVEKWERRAYEYLRKSMLKRGWPVENLEFEPNLAMRGLVIDTELGNVVKSDRFGYVKRAFHGTMPISFVEQKIIYAGELIDLSDPRWVFLNTFFSISEACMYMQMVDLVDEGKGPRAVGYGDLYRRVRENLDEAHMEGELKGEIIADPSSFVDLDPDTPKALMDQKAAGKKLLLITNSDWVFTSAMMGYAFDSFMPAGQSWRQLFDLVLCLANKPMFFLEQMPLFSVDEPTGFLRPVTRLGEAGTYAGGHAGLVERYLDIFGDEILYVGDHLFSDVHVTKNIQRCRTALVIRELEEEMEALQGFASRQILLSKLMTNKRILEQRVSEARLELQRRRLSYLPADCPDFGETPREIEKHIESLRVELIALDSEISIIAKESGELMNTRWGILMRTGNDKSNLARQVERYADVYMSRVSSFLWHTPFGYLRAPRGSLPHDPLPDGLASSLP